MFNQMKLGTRIWTGFGSVLVICGILGGTAVVAMSTVKTSANMLATEYVPEVSVANLVERNALKTLYAIRGWSYTYDPATLEIGKKSLLEVQTQLKNADDLASKSEHLAKLKEEVKVADEKTTEYEKLLKESEATVNTFLEARTTLNTHAAEFVTAINSYIDSQSDIMKEEIATNKGKTVLESRFHKVVVSNTIIDFGNAIIIATNRAQAERNPKFIDDVMGNFDKIEEQSNALIRISVDPKNVTQLNLVKKSSQLYKEATKTLVTSFKHLQDLTVSRGAAGDAVGKAAEETAKAGIGNTSSIANEAASLLGKMSTILIIGLLLAISLGLTIAYVITSSITSTISRISSMLGDASAQVRDASGQLSSASQELASSSAEQASSIEETTASIEEMSGMVANNVENAQRAAELSQKVSEISNHGNETMSKLQNSMAEILSSNEKIEQLVKVIAAIGEKTKVMDEIVFQTKLLSFNASVEAERAGEHGRGFAVVAQEVGNLAQMSGKAAQEIAGILTESLKQAEVITTENKKKVETGGHLVTETGTALREILQSATSVTSGANQVLEASKEQSSGIKQVNSAMNNLEKATQENSALAEEVASTSEELASQTDSLNAVVQELTALVSGASAAQYHQPQGRTPTIQHHDAHANVHSISKARADRTPKKAATMPMKKAVGAEGADDSWDKL